MTQGNCRIKRSPERLIWQGGLSKVCTMTHAVSPCINSGVQCFLAENIINISVLEHLLLEMEL